MIDDLMAYPLVLAEQLKLTAADSVDLLNENNAIFELVDEQLILHLILDNKTDQLKFDLADGEVAFRASNVSKSNEVIAKAIGCKPHYRPKVLDATAGMGRDSLIMAMLGCDVVMHERNHAIFLLLSNALQRLKQSEDFDRAITERLQINGCDSLRVFENLPDLKDKVDVVYLDPMFPERKKSALVKKEMRLFKRLVGEDLDANQLFNNALKSGVKRVVVKRPKGAPLLADKKPSHEIKAKKFRYDVYLQLG